MKWANETSYKQWLESKEISVFGWECNKDIERRNRILMGKPLAK
jgi:hypothetical protein